MKPKFKARELLWMILPVALLGGAGWWAQHGGRLGGLTFKNPLDSGPIRVKFTPFEKVELSPFDVSQGFEWAAKTKVEIVGKWNEPPGMKSIGDGAGAIPHLVYRRGVTWKQAVLKKNSRLLIHELANEDDGTLTLKVGLMNVPRDAEEVRLRGTFRARRVYSGTPPRGWKAPKNMMVAGSDRWLTLQSKPFDVQIKGPSEMMPKPLVSRATPLQFVDAKWIADPDTQSNSYLVKLRRSDGVNWKTKPPVFTQMQVWEANGQPIVAKGLFVEHFSQFGQDVFVPALPDSDCVVTLYTFQSFMEQQAFGGLQGPLHLRAQITDGICWPLSIDVKVPRVDMNLKDFGAAK